MKVCECGCKQRIITPDERGRVRKFVRGHNIRLNNPMKRLGIKKKDGRGYILIYKPDHPNKNCNNCVYEHRLVMEKQLGRYLTLKERVHHKNGIRDDNRSENLRLFKNESEHQNFHRRDLK